MTNARGIDISEHNAWVTRALLADWRQRYPDMCYGQYRASIGTRTDLFGRVHREHLLAEGYLTGPYTALHEADPIPAQALKFINLRSPFDVLPNWADIEREGLTERMVEQWCDVYDANTDQPLWIYTSQTAWNKIVRVNHQRYSKYGLVVADYGPGLLTSDVWKTPAGRPLIPKPWAFTPPPHYDIFQYAGDNGRLHGSSNGIDLSEYNGTEAELRVRLGATLPPAPPGDEEKIVAHANAILELL